jgi:hypothetical protein
VQPHPTPIQLLPPPPNDEDIRITIYLAQQPAVKPLSHDAASMLVISSQTARDRVSHGESGYPTCSCDRRSPHPPGLRHPRIRRR